MRSDWLIDVLEKKKNKKEREGRGRGPPQFPFWHPPSRSVGEWVEKKVSIWPISFSIRIKDREIFSFHSPPPPVYSLFLWLELRALMVCVIIILPDTFKKPHTTSRNSKMTRENATWNTCGSAPLSLLCFYFQNLSRPLIIAQYKLYSIPSRDSRSFLRGIFFFV